MNNEMIKFGKILFLQGLNNSHSGNMSFKKGSHIYITRHGAMLGSMNKKDIIKVNLNDSNLDAKASLETKVHRAVYLNCPGVNAITHAHPTHAIVLSMKYSAVKPIDHEGLYYMNEVPVFACKNTIASDEVAFNIPKLLEKHRICIVRGHGAFAVGKSIEEASMLLSVLESASKIIVLSTLSSS